jgi:LacI family transcriptional regulator
MPNMFKVIVLLDISRGYERGVLSGITRYLKFVKPWNIYTPDPYYISGGKRSKGLEMIKKWGASGIVMRDQKNADEILALKIPTILMPIKDRKVAKNVVIVKGKSELHGKMAAEHFLERRYRNFAFFGYNYMKWSQMRCKGFRDRVGQAGFDVNTYTQSKSRSQCLWYNEQNSVLEWIESLPKPVGLFACTDERSLQISQICALSKIRIPEEVAIIGVDDDELICNISNPPLSSIALNSERIGYEAAKMLNDMMVGKKIKTHTIISEPLKIIQRQSTDIILTDDDDLKNALLFIRSNVNRPLTASDVVEAVAVSRRSLYKKFHQLLGRGISEEIRRVRVEKVATLLSETDLPVSKIAREMGFLSSDHISRYFKIEKNITPSEYRSKYSRSIQ